jgi:cephalosporin hydroxylase
MTLHQLYDKYYDPKTGWPDKGTVHSYIEVYEEILAPYRKTANNILEIGLMSGESLRMWDEYFKGEVFGIDCSIKPIDGKADLTKAIEDGLYISIGDASDPATIERFYKGLKFDVIIEDAGHSLQQQLRIHTVLSPYLNKGGIYIIEDIQDIDQDADYFLAMETERNVEIIDRRKIKNRYDDVLIIIK